MRLAREHKLRLDDLRGYLNGERWEAYATTSFKRLEIRNNSTCFRVLIGGIEIYRGPDASAADDAYNNGY